MLVLNRQVQRCEPNLPQQQRQQQEVAQRKQVNVKTEREAGEREDRT
jgi:hypothetical protein